MNSKILNAYYKDYLKNKSKENIKKYYEERNKKIHAEKVKEERKD